MKLTHEDFEQMAVFAVRGDLTVEHTEQLRRAAQERMDKRTRDFVVDLTGVEFVDSKGLETLLWLQEQCGERLGQMRVAALTENVRKIIELTRLTSRLECHDTVDSAVKSLR